MFDSLQMISGKNLKFIFSSKYFIEPAHTFSLFPVFGTIKTEYYIHGRHVCGHFVMRYMDWL